MHASRTLTAAEKKYAQIEKEALALVFAVRRFHKMIYGRRFTLLTDHKPLLSIFGSKSGIPVHAANRLQRWAIILLGYDFDIKYNRTNEFGQADALSRLISDYPASSEDMVIASIATKDYAVNLIDNAIRSLPVTFAEIQRTTSTDATLRRATQYVSSNWPKIKYSGDLKHLFARRDSLCVVKDCLMFGERVVIPEALRNKLLKQFHMGHPGIQRMKSIARSYAYWPNMDKHIIDFVQRCSKCQQSAKLPHQLPPVPWPPASHPWSRIHIDFAGPTNGAYYLVVVDAFSKWPEVIPMVSPTTSQTLKALTDIFSHHGLPETIVTDNGSQFTSHQFQQFCHQN
uniref:Integrase catalytic domain-containing protein n=1 Tax=Trichobilharzia regenti TaxID=157069 RepID=A0AA85J8L0_TRIRE